MDRINAGKVKKEIQPFVNYALVEKNHDILRAIDDMNSCWTNPEDLCEGRTDYDELKDMLTTSHNALSSMYDIIVAMRKHYEMLLDKGGVSAYIAIRSGDFDKWGCPVCGSDYSHLSMSGGGAAHVTCGECGHDYILVNDSLNEVPFKSGKGEMSAGTVFIIEHPRKGIDKHKYKAPDIRPDGDGEYWKPRGIGYDLSGFVKSKEAGERIVAMFEKALGKKPETWLDFREREPNWIQVKVQSSEADLEKLYELTKETGIITYDIILSVIKNKEV